MKNEDVARELLKVAKYIPKST